MIGIIFTVPGEPLTTSVFEALEEILGEPDIKSLHSIPLGKIMQCVREDEGEVISIVNELTIEINVIVLSVSNKEVFNITRSGGQRLDSF